MMTKTLSLRLFGLLLLFAAGAVSTDAKKFRIMSFNIRLLTTADGDNIWTNRSDAVCKFIGKTAPDVFGVQEATKVQMDDLSKNLPDYAYVGVGRDDGKEAGEYSPVFYRKDKFKLIKSGTFWLSETPDKPSLGWDAACRRVCSWTLLQNVKTGNSFVYANTHLDHVGEKARVNGAMLIKERLSRIANNLPMLITGDFNVTSSSPAYSTMLNRIFALQDAYKNAKKRKGLKSSFNNWGKIADDKGNIIDFVFASPFLKAKKACLHDGNLGNGHYLSDHNALYVDFDGKEL